MKYAINILCLIIFLNLYGCEKNIQGAVELAVNFTWKNMKHCGWGNPEMRIDGIPETTKFLIINMYDHAYSYDHGTVKIPYTGNSHFPMGRFKEIQGPCPSWTPGRYEITVQAVDADETIIAVGSQERPFPE